MSIHRRVIVKCARSLTGRHKWQAHPEHFRVCRSCGVRWYSVTKAK